MNNAATTIEQVRPLLPVRLFNGFVALLEKARIRSTPIIAADLIGTAKRRSGLDAFVESERFEALLRLRDSCRDESLLNLIGIFTVKVDVLEALSARLKMER